MLRLLTQVLGECRQASATSLVTLNVREKAALLERIAEAQRALQATHLSVLRALEGDDLGAVGATSVAALVSARLRVPHGRARADVAAANATDPDHGDLPEMGRALAHGEASMGHVDVAVATLDRVPHRLRRECAPVIDGFLTQQSRSYRPRECAHLAREVLDRIHPDRAERGYDPEAFSRRSFCLTTDFYGMGCRPGSSTR